MKNPSILIAAASLDEHAYGPVSSILESRGYPVTVYQTDRVISSEDHFLMHINDNAKLTVSYNGNSISPNDIGAAWYRKLNSFDQSNMQDRTKQLYINSELAHMHETLWVLYPEDIWINSPAKIRQADRKLVQLLIASEVGFSIPETVVGSEWDDITSLLLKTEERIVAKTIRGIISEKDKLKAMYTTLLGFDQIEQMKEGVSPFPGLYQPFIDKSREWRVTVVGEDVFPAAIYTTGDARVDWRIQQTTQAVVFKHEPLPDGVEEKCAKYLGRMGLKFGAFDLIEQHSGEVTFLECNPNGQYGWLEESLGFPISRAIASELISIAKENT